MDRPRSRNEASQSRPPLDLARIGAVALLLLEVYLKIRVAKRVRGMAASGLRR